MRQYNIVIALLALVISPALLRTIVVVECSNSGNNIDKDDAPNINYNAYPKRESNEAAMVEWGHSAILQAIDAVVAKFGTQTSDGAYFEVEASIVLAEPINGDVNGADDDDDDDVNNAKLKNYKEVHGNMVILSNNSNKYTDVQLSKIGQNSGAAAVMIVNTKDITNDGDNNPNNDFIYSMEAQTDQDKIIADTITIPCIMVSLMSANQITTAGETEQQNDEKEEVVEASLPDRIRLYSSYDRPFFEDVSSPTQSNPTNPVIYIIHNLLTIDECDALITNAQLKVENIEDRIGTLLDGIDYSKRILKKKADDNDNDNIQTVYLWKGNVLRGHMGKEIDDRIEHSTGFTKEFMSDFHIYKYTNNNKGSSSSSSSSSSKNANLHHDLLENTNNIQLATITIFLNDDYYDDNENVGGEIIYPKANPSIKIIPKKGMAVVHHNVLQTDEEESSQSMQFDANSIHGDVVYTGQNEKWIAKSYFYKNTVSSTKHIILPILALPFGGKLPKYFYIFYDFILENTSGDIDYTTTIFEYSIMGMIGLSILCFVGIIYIFILGKSSPVVGSKSNNGNNDKTTSSSSSDGKKKKVKKNKKKNE